MARLRNITFEAMNTRIELACMTEESAAPEIERISIDRFRAAEDRFSRFKASSELCQLNRVAGARCLVSDPMLEVLLLAEYYRNATKGTFNPLILNALERAGYHETFDHVKQRTAYSFPMDGINVINRAEPFIDPIMKSIKLVPQSRLDLGGIVKSWTVKGLAAELRRRHRVSRGFINAGGDLAAWGSASENDDPWVIGIEDPWDAKAELGVIALRTGAVATSSKLGRQWPTSRGTMHHLIDPSSMMPSDSEVVQCTVVGPDIVECEIWAKTLCIRGVKDGLALMSRNASRCEALLFTSDRRIHHYGREDSIGHLWHNVPIDESYDSRERSFER